jgi:hypothetical protein
MQRPLVLTLLIAVFGTGLALAAPPNNAPNPNEREVKPGPNVQDPDDISAPDSKVWALEFKFKDPRILTVDVPGRGRKVCWYMWYQVINRTKEARTFIPEFELVNLDKNKGRTDQVLPKVQEAIRQVEDPTDYLKIKNSVTISAEPIPVSKEDAVPRAVTGVAIWDDVDPSMTRFSVFVSGLSNGWAVTDPIPPDTEPVVRRKTLQLNFKRLGDQGEIEFIPPAQWIYRGSSIKLPNLPGIKPKDMNPAPMPDK